MKGRSGRIRRTMLSAASPSKRGRAKSESTMSGANSLHWRVKSAAVSTRRFSNCRPERLSSRKMISPSDSTSSTIRILSSFISLSLVRARIDSRRQAIDQNPVAARFGDLFDKCREIDRLHDITVHAEGVARDDVALLGTGGQHHHWDRLSSFVRLDLAQNLNAVDLWHLQVEEHQLRGSIRSRGVDATAKEEVERFGTVLDPDKIVGEVLASQSTHRHLGVGFAVFDQQNLDLLITDHLSILFAKRHPSLGLLAARAHVGSLCG